MYPDHNPVPPEPQTPPPNKNPFALMFDGWSHGPRRFFTFLGIIFAISALGIGIAIRYIK